MNLWFVKKNLGFFENNLSALAKEKDLVLYFSTLDKEPTASSEFLVSWF